MFTILYQQGTVFCTLYLFFQQLIRESLPQTSQQTLKDCVMLVLAMLIEEKAYSVESLYLHVLVLLGEVGLNAYYAALSHSGMTQNLLLKGFVKAGLMIADKTHPDVPFILGCDDTTIKKFGKHFFGVGTLFDHSSHEKNKYINGHCFVSCCLKVPVPSAGGKWHYLGIPLGFQLWVPHQGTTKLKIAENIIKEVLELVGKEHMLIIVCDAWYTKKQLMRLTPQYSNLELIGNARSDTDCREFDPPETDVHKRGRKPAHGKKLSLDDFDLTEDTLNGFHLGVKKVACRMLKDIPVWAYVSSPNLDSENKSKRLFLSTIAPEKLASLLVGYESIPATFNNGQWELYSPMLIYAERWVLEVCFENMKTFWGLTEYKVRSEESLLTYINLINLAYGGTILLPYLVDNYKGFKQSSPQEIRKEVSQQLHKEISLAKLITECTDSNCKELKKNPLYSALFNALSRKYEVKKDSLSNNTFETATNLPASIINTTHNASDSHVEALYGFERKDYNYNQCII